MFQVTILGRKDHGLSKYIGILDTQENVAIEIRNYQKTKQQVHVMFTLVVSYTKIYSIFHIRMIDKDCSSALIFGVVCELDRGSTSN